MPMTNNYILFSSLVLSLQASAFDNDYSINSPNFNTENFLDIHYVQFTESLNDQWYRAENGWRISGHSLTTDLLYSQTEIKLNNQLSERVNLRLKLQQEVFYTEKDHPPLNLEVESRLFSDYPISASLLGTAEYKKAGSDLGLAVTFGNLTSNFFRYSEITVDYFHNQKNDSPAVYLKQQHLRTIELAWQGSSAWQLRLKLNDASPMHFLYSDQITLFKHQATEYNGVIKYKFNNNNSLKLLLKGFAINKSISGTVAKEQTLNYDTVDLKWLTRQQQAYAFTFGYRQDLFSNNIIDTSNTSSLLDYPFSTRQVYSTLHHPYSQQKAWELGLYLGLTREPNDFYNPELDNSHVYESKLASSWIYQAKNKSSTIFLHISWDLDGSIEDPADGGGITYQSTF
ncbi:MAG: hypothetical protein OEY11_15360 [Gammaproteobacteria bacterium]|nr:hypothetical protein [Gammaproteobacteria bacterium]